MAASRDEADYDYAGENVVFGTPEKTIENEFEIEIQNPLQEGETPPDVTEAPAHDGDASEATEDDFNNLTDELPELDPDLEAMVDDEDFVEIDPTPIF
ncbi:hypothetical protein COOONC_19995 [Cooperia oncophora]